MEISQGDFQSEVLERLRQLESDVSFIKGNIEGRNHNETQKKDRASLFISIGALVIAAIIAITRFIG